MSRDAIPREELNPICDLDMAVYAVGFAADTQAKEEFGPERYLEENYAHWAVGNMKTYVENILHTVFPKHKWYMLFLTGKKNYRDHVCRHLPKLHTNKRDGSPWTYKGNRDSSHKPKYYHELRLYLIEQWGAVYSDWREADDEVSIVQYRHPDRSTCIVSGDKDLDLCPGWRYNPKRKEFTYQSLKEANLAFWHMGLMGDGTDNIPGLAGIGKKKSADILRDCNYNIDQIKRESERLYVKQYGPVGREVWDENLHLLWMQREEFVAYDGSCLRRFCKEEINA